MGKTMSRAELKKRKDKLGVLIIGGCVAVAGAIGGAVALNVPPARDRSTGCINSAVTDYTLAIIDRTSPASAADQALERVSLAALAEQLPTEARLTVVPFDGQNEVVPTALFDRCKPAATGNPLFTTVERVEKVFVRDFQKPLSQVIDTVTAARGAQATYLVRFLSVAAGTLARQTQAKAKRIVLYTDGAEFNEQAALIGKRRLEPQKFATYFKDQIGTRLDGITVDVVVTPSKETPPGVAKQIKAAWEAAFAATSISYTWRHL